MTTRHARPMKEIVGKVQHLTCRLLGHAWNRKVSRVAVGVPVGHCKRCGHYVAVPTVKLSPRVRFAMEDAELEIDPAQCVNVDVEEVGHSDASVIRMKEIEG